MKERMMKQDSQSLLEEVRNDIRNSLYNYQEINHFFPSDISHGTRIKRICKRLYDEGLLEMYGYGTGRWGRAYIIPNGTFTDEQK